MIPYHKRKEMEEFINQTLANSDTDLLLDRYNLEEEAERIPELTRIYGKAFAMAKALVKDEEIKLKRTKLLLSKEIRKDKKKHGLIKDTKDNMELCYVKFMAFQQRYYLLIQMTNIRDDLSACVDGVRQKASMIKEQVQLHKDQYWSKITR